MTKGKNPEKKFNNGSGLKDKPLYLRNFILALVFTIATFSMLVFNALWSAGYYRNTALSKSRMTQTIGAIVYLDEALTMSARMAAATGDPMWERRYKTLEPQLGRAIKQAEQAEPELFLGSAALRTQEANDALVQMEYRAFDLVHAGRRAEADSLLTSPDYEAFKLAYAQGFGDMKKAMAELDTLQQSIQRRKLLLSILFTGIMFPLMMALWIWVLRIIKKHDTERRQAEIIQNIQINIAHEVVQIESLEQMLLTVRNELGRVMDTANFFVAMYNPETDTLRKVIFLDEKDEFTEWKAEGSFSGYVAQQGKSLLLDKKQSDEFTRQNRMKLLGTPSECWLGVPLIIENQAIGVMVVQSYIDPDAYNQASAVLLGMVAHELSLYIDRRRMIDDLVVAKEKAEESDLLKSIFLANMSHEIRTPLNSIIGFSELLSEEKNDPDEVIRYSSIIASSGNRMLQLINNLIDISKVESGTESIRISTISPVAVIEEVVSQFKIMAERKSLRIIGNFPSGLKDLNIQTDSLKLEQILTNLVNNAIKFTSEGYIEVGFEKHSGKILFFVKDTGIGIPANNLDKVFDRFYQVDTPWSMRPEGAGLGLALCKVMVELLGGRIWVESEEGKGSIFRFTIGV